MICEGPGRKGEPRCKKEVVARIITKQGPIDVCATHIGWAYQIKVQVDSGKISLEEAKDGKEATTESGSDS